MLDGRALPIQHRHTGGTAFQLLGGPKTGTSGSSIPYIFAYLKLHNPTKLVFDNTKIDWDSEKFKNVDWSNFYRGAEEEIPPNAPEVWEQLVQINCFMDADHAGNKVMRCSQPGILIYLNSVLMIGIPRGKTPSIAANFESGNRPSW
jgi:hypothetical protein